MAWMESALREVFDRCRDATAPYQRRRALNFHYFYEFSADDRFQGQSISLTATVAF